MRKIRTGDKVRVISGKDAGKEGKVQRVIEKQLKNGTTKVTVVVESVNMVKRAMKANPQLGIPGGIQEYEKPIDISNIMYLEEGKPVRVGFQIDEKTGKKYRVSKKTGKRLD